MHAAGLMDALTPGVAVADWSRAVDWSALGESAVDLLRQYLRIATPNDPASLSVEASETRPWEAGCEAEAAAFIAAQLRADGIEAQLFEAAPGRVNVVARLKGRTAGGAITLLTHSDVVPARREEWSRDPFGGEVHDGFVYGRGALDLKGLGIVHLLTLVALKRLRVPLERDVVLMIVADEETGGRWGAEWLLGQQPELLDSQVVLGEGAYSVEGMLPGGQVVQAVAVGEKGYLELELVAEGDGGHASMPAKDNAPARLVRALDRVLAMKLPMRLAPLTRAFLGNLAQAAHGLHGSLMRHPRLLALIGADPFANSTIINAMVRDTVVATVLQAGQKHNVVPTEARAILSIRLLPETDADALSESVGRICAECGVSVRRLMYKRANASPLDAWPYRLIERHLRREHRDAIVTPILSPAASDCRFFRAHGVPSYGWVPFTIPSDDLHRVHGADERVSIAALNSGVRSFCKAVLALATARSDREAA